MPCQFKEFEPARDDGWRRMRCERCGLTSGYTPHPPEKIFVDVECGVGRGLVVGESVIVRPQAGVGMEMLELLHSLGAEPHSSCNCAARAAEMNVWGIAGCREHREEIVGWLREAYAHTTWIDRMRAAGNAVLLGLAFKLDWNDPIPGILDEAIRRTEAKEQK